MLRYFFDKQEDYRDLFTNLAITQSPAWAHQGKYPVLFITLKDCKGLDWAEVRGELAEAVRAMFKPHSYLLEQPRPLDEYDSGLINAHQQGFYPQMRHFLQKLFSKGLKDNAYLRKAVVTGILRVAKESLFSGINNLSVGTVLSQRYANRFGLTLAEVQTLVAEFGQGEQMEKVFRHGFRGCTNRLWWRGSDAHAPAIYPRHSA